MGTVRTGEQYPPPSPVEEILGDDIWREKKIMEKNYNKEKPRRRIKMQYQPISNGEKRQKRHMCTTHFIRGRTNNIFSVGVEDRILGQFVGIL
jgi:hypothetical protein